MVLNLHRNHKAYGSDGGGGGGGGGIIYLSQHCHHQNDLHNDESYFNVSLIMRNKVTRQCPQTTTSEEKGEPK